MTKLFLVIITVFSIFVSIGSYLFLPVSAYLIATLLTNSNEFSLARHKKTAFYFLGLIIILSLVSISKFI